MGPDGEVASLVDNYRSGRFNRPNDVICHSNGYLYFTDPDKRRRYHEREIPGPAREENLWDGARVYRLAPAKINNRVYYPWMRNGLRSFRTYPELVAPNHSTHPRAGSAYAAQRLTDETDWLSGERRIRTVDSSRRNLTSRPEGSPGRLGKAVKRSRGPRVRLRLSAPSLFLR
jgi:hypothetical protein